jgi:hypothetical protein
MVDCANEKMLRPVKLNAVLRCVYGSLSKVCLQISANSIYTLIVCVKVIRQM